MGQTVGAFHRWRHWSVGHRFDYVAPQQGEQIEHLMFAPDDLPRHDLSDLEMTWLP